MVFKKQEAKDEVNKYLEETKAAVKSSKDVFKNSNTKELFFEVANNLANLLKEVQDQESLGFEAKKDELNFYIKYFDRVEELMIETEKTAPYATIAIRRGLPILDRNLRSLLEEIQEKAKTACNKSIGTPTQEIASTVNMEVQKWEIGSQEEMSWYVNSLVTVLKSKIPHNFENREILGMIESMKYEKDLTKQYRTLSTVMGLIPTVNVIPNQVVKDIKDIKEKIIPVPEDLKELRGSIDQLTASIDKLQNPQECLNIIQRDLKEIKVYIPGMKEQIDKLLDELDTPLSTTQKLKISIPIIPSLVSYEQETDVPKFVADRIDELKSLVLHFKQR